MPGYTSTRRACQAVITTRIGMRRILKEPLSPKDYIKKAVETGVYRTREEIEQVQKERVDSTDDLRVVMNRFRQDIVRGSNVMDYPIEYLILEQNPPLPNPPRIPKKHELKVPPNPVAVLAQKQLKRHEQKQMYDQNNMKHGNYAGAPLTAEDYYRRLLGIDHSNRQNRNKPTTDFTSLQHQPPNVQKAYVSAMKQYELQRTEGLTEQQALEQVEVLLQQESQQERDISHARTQQTQAFCQEQQHSPGSSWKSAGTKKKNSQKKNEVATTTDTDTTTPPLLSSPSPSPSSSHDEPSVADQEAAQHTLQSIFGATPKTMEGMMRWSERLEQVPYREWTIGASTSLDHWIARQLLGLSEETWQELLYGQYDNNNDNNGLLSKGRDIVAVRESLFPETILEDRIQSEHKQQEREDQRMIGDRLGNDDDDDDKADDDDDDNEKALETLDQLLSSLGGVKNKSSTSSSSSSSMFPDWKTVDADTDAKMDRLVEELQEWRRQAHNDKPYEEWSETDKSKFDTWFRDYIHTVAPQELSQGTVDLQETREALLAPPPVTAEESQAFWSQLQHEGQAEALLDVMLKDGPPPGAGILQSAFWELPREQQLTRLMNLGALRPLLDEYVKETDRLKFLQRHGDTMLMGVELEHLVSDPDGPIRASDLSREVIREWNVREGDRFRMELRPYNAGAGGGDVEEKSRLLYKAWNEQKVGRALYEEKMFRTGRLGLRYGDSTDGEPAEQRNSSKNNPDKKK